MQRHLLGLAALAMALVAAGCVKDPTSDLAGTPTRIVATFSKLLMTEGDTVLIEAELRDEQGTPLAIMPVATAPTPAVVDIVEQQQAVPQPKLQVRVAAKLSGPGRIVLSYENIVDSIVVAVFPPAFDGDVAVLTGGQLDTVTIAATSVITFDPAATTVTIEDVPARILSISSSQITALARNTGAETEATITLANAVFAAGTVDEVVIQSIDAATTPDIRGEANEPGNNARATATAVPVNGFAEGLISTDDRNDYLTFTLAAPGTVTVEVSFDGDGGDPDIDVQVLDAAGVDQDWGMESGSQPELGTGALAAGTYYVRIIWFAAGADTPPHYYKVGVTTS